MAIAKWAINVILRTVMPSSRNHNPAQASPKTTQAIMGLTDKDTNLPVGGLVAVVAWVTRASRTTTEGASSNRCRMGVASTVLNSPQAMPIMVNKTLVRTRNKLIRISKLVTFSQFTQTLKMLEEVRLRVLVKGRAAVECRRVEVAEATTTPEVETVMDNSNVEVAINLVAWAARKWAALVVKEAISTTRKAALAAVKHQVWVVAAMERTKETVVVTNSLSHYTPAATIRLNCASSSSKVIVPTHIGAPSLTANKN